MSRGKKVAIYLIVAIVLVIIIYFALRKPTKLATLDGAYIDLADGSEVLVASKGNIVTIVKADGIKTFKRQGNKLDGYLVSRKGSNVFLMDDGVCVMALEKDEDFDVSQ